jgi:uncharacterized membrane protein (UPF0127 family)
VLHGTLAHLAASAAVANGSPDRQASTTPAWLLSDGRVLCSLEVASTHAARRHGLLGRDGTGGALLIDRCRWVHTVGMRFALDVAYLDREGNVLKTVRMLPQRVGLPMVRARSVVEAEAGAFARWGLHVGDHLEVRHS